MTYCHALDTHSSNFTQYPNPATTLNPQPYPNIVPKQSLNPKMVFVALEGPSF